MLSGLTTKATILAKDPNLKRKQPQRSKGCKNKTPLSEVVVSAPEVEVQNGTEDHSLAPEVPTEMGTEVDTLTPEENIVNNTQGFVLSADPDTCSPLHEPLSESHNVDGLQTNGAPSSEPSLQLHESACQEHCVHGIELLNPLSSAFGLTLSQVSDDIAQFAAWRNSQEADNVPGNFDDVFHGVQTSLMNHSPRTEATLQAYELHQFLDAHDNNSEAPQATLSQETLHTPSQVSKEPASYIVEIGNRSARKAVRAAKRAERESKKAAKLAKRAEKNKKKSASVLLTATRVLHYVTLGEKESHNGVVKSATEAPPGTSFSAAHDEETHTDLSKSPLISGNSTPIIARVLTGMRDISKQPFRIFSSLDDFVNDEDNMNKAALTSPPVSPHSNRPDLNVNANSEVNFKF